MHGKKTEKTYHKILVAVISRLWQIFPFLNTFLVFGNFSEINMHLFIKWITCMCVGEGIYTHLYTNMLKEPFSSWY
jgi:hypothetical protein